MKNFYVNKRIILHAAYTSLLILVGFVLYDSGTTLRLYLIDIDYFKDKPIISDIIIRFVHVAGIFIFDIALVYLIYKLFDVIY